MGQCDIVSARLKINFFTPLPPLRTSIADHSARLLDALAEIADVAVWTDQATWDEIGIAGVTVHRFDSETDPACFHTADMNFYNLGNNHPFHGKIYGIARRVPGIVIIHDPNMGYFFGTVADSPDGRRRYLKFVARQYGPEALDEALRMFAGKARLDQIMLRYPMTEAALEGAVGALVDQEALQQQLAKSTGLPVYYTPLSHSKRITQLTAGSSPPYKLITFGYLGSNRRLEDIAKALSTFPQRDQFTWDIYGTIQVRGMATRLAKLKLGHRITIHNYVEEEVLDRALAGANLAINLRNPTMGEASSSQLRIWEHGVPALVSRVGWYAAQPSDTVFFVEPGQEIAQIQKYLAEFLRDPEAFKAAGARGRDYLYRVHGTKPYARSLVDIAAHGSKLRVKRAALDLSNRAIQTIFDMVGPEWVKLQTSNLREKIYGLVGEINAGDRATESDGRPNRERSRESFTPART